MAEYQFEVTLNEHGQRLDKMLARRLDMAIDGGFSRNKTKKLLDANKVVYNGRVERFGSRSVEYDDIIEVDVDASVVGSPKSHENVELNAGDILWHDDLVVVIDKPAGLPSQKTRDPNRDYAVAAVERYLKQHGKSDPYLALHHRLDVGTSGAMLLACDERANEGISRAFDERRVHKTYRAIGRRTSSGPKRDVGDSWVVENHLARRRSDSTTRQVAVDSGGDYAQTEFEVRDVREGFFDIVARPTTGRRHQIRSHLADSGLPIVGDERYGGVERLDGEDVERMMLHAWRLRLDHPVYDTEIDVTSPVPETIEDLV